MNFAVNVGFPHAAGNQLGILGAEVEDEYFLMHGVFGNTELSLSRSCKHEIGEPDVRL